MVFIWGERGYPPIHFEYKMASAIAGFKDISKTYLGMFRKIQILKFFWFWWNYFPNIAGTKYLSYAILCYKTNRRISFINLYKDWDCTASNKEAEFWLFFNKGQIWTFCVSHRKGFQNYPLHLRRSSLNNLIRMHTCAQWTCNILPWSLRDPIQIYQQNFKLWLTLTLHIWHIASLEHCTFGTLHIWNIAPL